MSACWTPAITLTRTAAMIAASARALSWSTTVCRALGKVTGSAPMSKRPLLARLDH
mgnify:CR=1 FL=1